MYLPLYLPFIHYILSYLDDFAINIATFKEYTEILHEISNNLWLDKLQLNWEKC
jgi:hypothetical protein